MVTLRDVAERVGCAVSTVSRVLNAVPDARVTEETRQRVLRAAAELDYRPNRHARVLANGKSSHVTVLVWPWLNQPAAVRTWLLTRSVLNAYPEVFVTDISSLSDPDDVLQLLSRDNPAAVVVNTVPWAAEMVERVVSRLVERETLSVVVECAAPMAPHVPCHTVMADRAQGSELATSHLVGCGHTHIAFVGLASASRRLAGYERALETHGIVERYVAEVPTNTMMHAPGLVGAAARETAKRLLRSRPEVTGLVCSSDLIALGAMRALDDVGRAFPDEVAVVGFDNEAWTEHLPIPLTTIAHPVNEICAAVGEIVHCHLTAGPYDAWQRLVFDHTLVQRESTK